MRAASISTQLAARVVDIPYMDGSSLDRGGLCDAQEWVQPWRCTAPRRLRLTCEQLTLVESVRSPLYDLAKLVAQRGGSSDVDDLHQIATECALRLLPKYRPDRGATFLTFVFWRARAAMKDSLKAEKRDRSYAAAAERAISGMQDTREVGELLNESPRARRERGATERYALAAAATILACDSAPESPEELMLMAEERTLKARVIEAARERLDARTNDLLRACFWEDKSLAEAARQLGLEYDQARYRLQSALALIGTCCRPVRAPGDAEHLSDSRRQRCGKRLRLSSSLAASCLHAARRSPPAAHAAHSALMGSIVRQQPGLG